MNRFRHCERSEAIHDVRLHGLPRCARSDGVRIKVRVREWAGHVWPISAGSWALRNELAYMRLNPQVPASIKRIVFVLNSGDFGNTASSWA